ncbi:type II toxin-antitoxin system VapC family toxin [Leifsonia shinshuensis]|uniref:type II toxin-antitoxin system VapC family toxin n=1 Tax=Leifsonia shinshuensis TaxID=150026 RepID=UPI00285DFDB1|nr:type II toxin-antitoxin system VapC family toxin [Leifsonia shinshuensis]MDR6970855.1 putative nucleic acid-binding protein [Leifsonia shinshuensis]
MTIAVDAGVLIALLDPDDAHHPAAVEAFAVGTRYLVHPVNLAEALVNPERAGVGVEAFEDFQRFGVIPTSLGPNGPLLLARIRAKHRLRMPDSCALALAVGNDIRLITFDKQLASAASTRGLYEPVPV